MPATRSRALPLLCLVVPIAALAIAPAATRADQDVASAVARVEEPVIAWRRDFHAHPELGNREIRTAGIVAAELERLGLEVRTGIAHTGVVGVLRGGQPGPTVALRADMDALPVTERTGLPFASTVRTPLTQTPYSPTAGVSTRVAPAGRSLTRRFSPRPTVFGSNSIRSAQAPGTRRPRSLIR